LGDTVTTARVRGVMARRMASTSSWKPGPVGTVTARPPTIEIAISWLK
jgi:hypothetical protein